MKTKAQKWDGHYRKAIDPPAPCYILKNNADLLPTNGCALDLACGLGGNTLFLAQQGMEAHAWDISQVALDKLQTLASDQGLNINTRHVDVESNPPESNSFDVIVVSHFLNRSICPMLVNALKPNGLLFYQTFLRNKPVNIGPSNPGFLLEQNELTELFSGLETITFREYYIDNSSSTEPVGSACFIGRKRPQEDS
jgi:SAM-dependent methyltransferase